MNTVDEMIDYHVVKTILNKSKNFHRCGFDYIYNSGAGVDMKVWRCHNTKQEALNLAYNLYDLPNKTINELQLIEIENKKKSTNLFNLCVKKYNNLHLCNDTFQE